MQQSNSKVTASKSVCRRTWSGFDSPAEPFSYLRVPRTEDFPAEADEDVAE